MSSKVARFKRKAPPPAHSVGNAPSSWHAAQETYALVTLNYKSVARIGAVPLLIVGTLQALYALYPTLLNLLLTVCGNLAATGMFAVGLQRMVASSVQHQLYRFQFAAQRWRIITAVTMALIPVVLLSLGILALGYVLAQNLLAPSVLGILLLIGIVMGLGLAAYTAVRFSVIMPAIALDEPIDLQSAVRATRGRAWQLWRGLLATLSPVLIVAAGLSFYAARNGGAAWAASSLQGFTVITAVPLSVVFLTLSYFRYVRREAKPKMKIIGEPAWYVRAWYDMQRVFAFVAKVAVLAAQQFKAKPKPAANPVAKNWPPQKAKTATATTAVRRTPRFEAAAPGKPVSEKEHLARKVAEKLADLEEEKLAQLAALLERGEKRTGTASPSAQAAKTAKAAGTKKSTAATAPQQPVRRVKTAQRSAGARQLNDMLAANENGKQGLESKK